MKSSTTFEEFVENYIENKKRADSPDSYRDWIISNGVNSEKLYSEAIRDISGDYNRAKSEYGTRAEKLSSLGLSSSGYSDYLSGKAYSEMQKRKQSAKESYAENEMKNLYHGEAVAIGMIPMCESTELKERLKKALKNISLDTDAAKHISDKDALLEALKHDKKSASGGKISAVLLRDIGNFEFTSLTPEEIIERLD